MLHCAHDFSPGGALGAGAPPRAEKTFRRVNLQGKAVSAPSQAESAPRAEEESILGNWEIWTVEQVI